MADQTVVRARDEGDAIWMLGGRYDVKVAGDETDGAMTVVEMWTPAGMGPPPHTHPGAESVYVLEGKIANLPLPNRTITGTWKNQEEGGALKLARQ